MLIKMTQFNFKELLIFIELVISYLLCSSVVTSAYTTNDLLNNSSSPECPAIANSAKCCNSDEFQCHQGDCIPMSKVCDESSQRDCPDGSDEMFCSNRSCSDREPRCPDICYDLSENKSRCFCSKYLQTLSYHMQVVCDTLDKCKRDNKKCTHGCAKGTDDEYECVCKNGFKKSLDDSESCIVTDGDVLILYNNNSWIYSYNVTSMKIVKLALTGIMDDIAYDPLTNTLYCWYERFRLLTRHYLTDLSLKPEDEKDNDDGVVSNWHYGVLPRLSLAADWTVGNLYWLIQQKDHVTSQIKVSRVNGKFGKVLVNHIKHASSLVLDPEHSTMYWFNGANHTQISSSRMNGLNQKLLAKLKEQKPKALTLDSGSGHLYWFDSISNNIYSMHSNHKVIDKVFSISNLNDIPLKMDIFENYIYWITESSNKLVRHDKFGRGSIEILGENLVYQNSLRVIAHNRNDDPNIKYAKTLREKCKACSYLCIRIPHGFGCVCPPGSGEIIHRGHSICKKHKHYPNERALSYSDDECKSDACYYSKSMFPHMEKHQVHFNFPMFYGILIVTALFTGIFICLALSLNKYRKHEESTPLQLQEVQ